MCQHVCVQVYVLKVSREALKSSLHLFVICWYLTATSMHKCVLPHWYCYFYCHNGKLNDNSFNTNVCVTSHILFNNSINSQVLTAELRRYWKMVYWTLKVPTSCTTHAFSSAVVSDSSSTIIIVSSLSWGATRKDSGATCRHALVSSRRGGTSLL